MRPDVATALDRFRRQAAFGVSIQSIRASLTAQSAAEHSAVVDMEWCRAAAAWHLTPEGQADKLASLAEQARWSQDQ